MDGLAAESFRVYTAAVSVMAVLVRLTLAKLFDPPSEEVLAGGFDIDEFYAHADTCLYDADDRKAFNALTLAGESDPSSRFQRERLGGTNKAPAEGDIGGHAGRLRSSFQID